MKKGTSKAKGDTFKISLSQELEKMGFSGEITPEFSRLLRELAKADPQHFLFSIGEALVKDDNGEYLQRDEETRNTAEKHGVIGDIMVSLSGFEYVGKLNLIEEIIDALYMKYAD